MKLIRSIAMTTDYTFHGSPCEVTRIDLYIAEEVLSPEVIKLAERMQEERLLHSRKSELHSNLYREQRDGPPKWQSSLFTTRSRTE